MRKSEAYDYLGDAIEAMESMVAFVRAVDLLNETELVSDAGRQQIADAKARLNEADVQLDLLVSVGASTAEQIAAAKQSVAESRQCVFEQEEIANNIHAAQLRLGELNDQLNARNN